MPVPDYIRKMRALVGHELIVIVGTSAVIRNERGEILLQHRSDNGLWGIPGGVLDPGEDPAAGIIREVWEETGLDVVPERLIGVYGGPDHIEIFPNGDTAAVTSICFACCVRGGALKVDDDESLDLRWFMPDALPDNMVEVHRPRIEHMLMLDTAYFRL
jgi:8-oxo-dGTP diphosphatase